MKQIPENAKEKKTKGLNQLSQLEGYIASTKNLIQ